MGCMQLYVILAGIKLMLKLSVETSLATIMVININITFKNKEIIDDVGIATVVISNLLVVKINYRFTLKKSFPDTCRR